jgi:hypothetical protein
MPYTEQELLNGLVRCHNENGSTAAKVLNDSANDYPTQPTYHNNFGSMNEARKQAGVPVMKQSQRWTRDDVIEQIKEVVDENGYFRLSMMDDIKGPNKGSVYTHFDGVDEALQCVFDDREIDTLTQKPVKYSKDELVEYMQECEDIYGKVSIDIMNNDSYLPSSNPYYSLFDNFEDAKEKAGVDKYERNSYDYYKYSALELLELLQDCYESENSTLAEDIQNFDKAPSPSVYNRRFGSIVSARELADIPQPKIDYKKDRKYTTTEIIEHLKEVYESEGDTKTNTLDAVEGPSTQVYQSRFDSLETAREVANLPVTQYIKNEKWMNIVGKDLDNIDGYVSDADRYVYVLELDLRGDEAYYIGQTKNPYKRIKQYITSTPAMRLNKVTEHGLAASRREAYVNTGAEVTDVKYIISMSKENSEDEQNFVDRVKERERRESFTVAIDKNCVNVFGGR